jgi:biofilm protein TabA
MLLDTIDNAASYVNLSSSIATALGFLSRHDLAKLPLGRHEIEGDRIFAIIQEYPTRPREQCFWEAHRKYIDVQFIQTGVEAMGWSPIQRMKVSKHYDEQKDLTVFDGKGQVVEVPANSFIIFMPHDVHMPCLTAGNGSVPHPVRKIVVKVAVE